MAMSLGELRVGYHMHPRYPSPVTMTIAVAHTQHDRYDTYVPTGVVESVTVTLRLGGEIVGDAWFAGVGVVSVPSVACTYVGDPVSM